MPAGAGTPRYEKPELWLGTANWHRGFCHAPPRPQRGTSPRATFPSPTPHNRHILETNRGIQVMNWIEGVCFRTNRTYRLRPAHRGMKNRSCGLVQRIGTADSATPLLRPSGGQAPALHAPLPTPLIPALAGITVALRRPHKRMNLGRRRVVSPLPAPLDSGLRRNDEWGAGLTKWGAGVANERLPERSIPDRSPGHAFIGIAHAGWGRHTKV